MRATPTVISKAENARLGAPLPLAGGESAAA